MSNTTHAMKMHAPMECKDGMQAAALCYVPATRNYWVTGQHGNIQAFDPRAPGDVTPFIKATRYALHAIQTSSAAAS